VPQGFLPESTNLTAMATITDALGASATVRRPGIRVANATLSSARAAIQRLGASLPTNTSRLSEAELSSRVLVSYAASLVVASNSNATDLRSAVLLTLDRMLEARESLRHGVAVTAAKAVTALATGPEELVEQELLGAASIVRRCVRRAALPAPVYLGQNR
jgi:hypothetical protein